MATTDLKPASGRRDIILGIMAYLGTLCFIPLMVTDRDAFVLFHARQGVVLWGWTVVAGFSLFIPGIGGPIFVFSLIGVVGFSVAGIVSVVLRKTWKLPIIYKLSIAI
ncbi:hypothetical protein [Magnetovibrio blakemorei]|uniref:Magnetosome protein MamF n=1 Tax=Magnetovibrio blakemorei TaxID=28181 RepID=A0A1E5Q555_9PROT|nr:hypothetical protein [Magnetovibrio blakemorei]OEJ64754.1 hypothetical protein BEN30_16075 [Magnetovibrio blakemorei]